MTWTNESFLKYRLMAPGPVPLHPQVLEALSQEMVHHRTPLFDRVLKNALQKLKKIFLTEEPVYIISGVGSSGMEAALVNTLSPGDEVLSIVSGKFGERWADMAQTFGYKVHTMNVTWGEAVSPSEVEKFLNANPNIKAVLCQACETSTAVLHPIQKLGEIISKHPQTLFLVDGITAVAATHLPMDEWKIDVLVAGSQKAFMLPAGLSFISLSRKAQAALTQAKTPRYYLDLRKEKKANENGETFFSSPVSLIRALDKALDIMLDQELDSWIHEIQERADFTAHIARTLNLEIYSHSPSPSLTAIKVPEGLDGQKWRSHLEQNYNLTVMGGQDQLKGKILRVGHMGYITKEDLFAWAGAMYKSLKDFDMSLALSEEEFYATTQKTLGLSD